MRKILISLTYILLVHSAALAQVPGLWFGDESKDPITDKTTALAMIYDDAGTGLSAALRCKDGKFDFFVGSGEPNFKLGEASNAILRVNDEAPKEFPALAVEPKLLVLDVRAATGIALDILHAKKFALRVRGLYSRALTMTFTPGLPTNTLHMIGRVAAACDIAPYPKDEIEAAVREIMRDSSKKKSRR